jgi:hypothetical protein
VANVNLPAPLVYAGAALCLLGGYVIGVVAGPQTADQTVATVESYSSEDRELCLTGEALTDDEAAVDGVLCGEWRRAPGAKQPREGDLFRFVAVQRSEGEVSTVYLYGDVVGPRR